MKQPFTAFRKLLVLALTLGTGYASWGQTYTPIALTGFNQDVIAEGTGAVPSLTTYDVDGAAGTGYSFMSANYVNPSGVANTTTHPIPNNGTITSIASATTGLSFQLAGFAANNVLRVPATGNTGGGTGTGADAGTVTFATPSAASVVYVLATGGGAAITSALSVTVTFTDATTQAFTGQTLPDWYTPNGATVAYQGFGRVARTAASGIDLASATTPNLYQLAFTLTGTNVTKPIASITFGKTTTAVGVINVFAVSTVTYPACTAPPTAGTAVASPTSLCAGGTTTLTLTGISAATGLTYQWQSAPNALVGFTNIAGATGSSYTTAALTQTTIYRAVVTCSGQSANSGLVIVTVLAPTYATLPYTQGFENTWLSRCGTDDAPDASWLNTPVTGNNSWRREDDGASASWTSITSGAYTPTGSNAGGASSAHSARFHNYSASNGSIGTLDLYLNLTGGTGTPTLKFDYRNSDSNAVAVLLSTDGGVTFSTTALQTLGTATAWTSYTVSLPTTVTATTVIRFRATSNYGLNDTGLDNVSVSYVSCGAPTGLAATTTAAGATASTSLVFTAVAGAVNYAFTISPAVTGAPTTATTTPISLTGLAYSTTYTVTLTTNCGSGSTSQATTYTFTTPCAPPVYATLPYAQGFENTWISRCGTDDVPDNSWANTPVTGNNSWRRDDDGVASGGWSSNGGSYTPAGSNAGGASSSHSARFHNYNAPSGSTGTLDLYVNVSGGTGTPTLKFDYRNSDSNAVVVQLSTDGGATFPTTLQTLGTVTAWTSYTVSLPTTVTATSVIRFKANGTNGSADTGVDNVSVSYISCAAPTGLAATSTAAGATVSTSLAFTAVAGAVNYAFTISPAVTGAPTTATTTPINLTGLAYSTTYTVTLTTNCGSGSTSQATTYTFATPCAPPVYATLPYAQGFENTWISRCGTDDVPDNSWANTPVTGNNSWRRDDDGASANWSSPTFGAYTPAGSQGSSHSARFHSSYISPAGTVGTLDLYANLSAAGTKRLTFDYVSVSTSTGKLDILLSTDGGATFSATPLLSLSTAAAFTAQTVDLTTTSATAVIRFRGTSDYGSYDIGVDNVQLRVLAAVDIAPTALATPTSTQSCYGSAETVSVVVTNQGTTTLNFANNPATVTAVVTTPGGPQTLTGSITTGTLAAGATQTVTLAPTLNMTATGTYTFAITATVTGDGNTANDLLAPAPTRTVTAPVAGTLSPSATSICNSGTAALTLAGAANGSIQYQSSTSATGPFTNITGATSATYTTPVLTTTTYYRAQVSCGANVATSNVSTITVNVPVVASTNTPVAVCSGNTATLTATASAGSSVRFFTAATGGTALTTTTAGTYTTPALTASTTYYAEAYTGGSETVGKATSNQTNGGYSGTATGLAFTTTGALTIQTATVYNATATAGSMSVDLVNNATGAIITTAGPFAVPAGSTTTLIPTVLTLNLAVPAAGTYRLVTSSTPTPPTLYRDSGANNSFPYTSPSGQITITSGYISGTSTSYYFFYNIQVSGECVGAAARTAIQVNVTQPATAGFSYPTTAICAGTTATLTPTLATGATAGTYSLPTATGLSINATTGAVTVAATAAAGPYTVTNTVAATGGCGAVTSTATFTVTPATTATFSYAGSPFCTTGTTATPTVTGTAGGTFSSTTGLTINATTGAITLGSSTPGNYTVTYTVAGTCGSSSTQTVTITAPQTAGFSYPTSTVCAGSTATLTPTMASGAAAGTFTLPTATGLTINATTGAVTVGATATAGVYTVTNTVAASGGCAAVTSTASFTITPATTATFSYAGSPFCTTGTTATPTVTGTAGGTFSSTAGLTINATTGAITLSSSAAGTYTVTYTVAGACGSSSTQTVTITAPQTAGFSYAMPVTGTACAGSNSTFIPVLATGATAGTFSSPTGLTINATTGVISLAGSAAGTYTITNTVAASGGCAAVTSTTTFTVNPVPATPTLTVTGTPATGITLMSSSATGNQFYLNGNPIVGATGQSYLVNSGKNNGTYTVVVTNASGCSSAASTAVTVTVTASAPASAGTSLSVYPNPTRDGLLTLELSGYREAVQLSIVNALGQRVYETTVSGSALSQKQALNLSQLATGVYTLQARTASGGVEIRRIVRE